MTLTDKISIKGVNALNVSVQIWWYRKCFRKYCSL